MNTDMERPTSPVNAELVRQLANTVRGLSIDATNAASSGHPGLPLGTADMAVTLWYYFLRYNPGDPAWPGRDKFILSAGHGSMLLYSLLHLAGYDLSLDDLKQFRQWGSRTPGHPEAGVTAGVEVTTGPLGQGFANGVGMALADAMMAARVHQPGFEPFSGYTYAIVSDGDIMEGVAQEAASFAGHHKLGRLIYLYDDNSISLDGPTELSFHLEKTPEKFEAMGWHTLTVDGHDPQQVADAIVAAQEEIERPSLICCKTVIGFGSPNKAGTSGVHGAPLGPEEGAATKENLGIPNEEFHVPDSDRQHWERRAGELKEVYTKWKESLHAAESAHPEQVRLMRDFQAQELPADLHQNLPIFEAGKEVPTRKAGQAALKAIAPKLPWLAGGSADLSVSTNAIIDSDGKLSADNLKGRHLFFGVREHAMGGIVNGIAAHGFLRPFGATFLTFSDYMRGSIRLAALTKLPSIFVFTHDSIFLGEDGPTHQPVEHVMALRLIPGLRLFRPGDAIETAEVWAALARLKDRPAAICLTRQGLPVYDRDSEEFLSDGKVENGGYTFRKEKDATHLDGLFIGTGSELQLCVEAARLLEREGLSLRVVSMPCCELFLDQPADYQERILPKSVLARVSVEAGVTNGWQRFVGLHGKALGIDRFGESAPWKIIASELGFTAENAAETMRNVIKGL